MWLAIDTATDQASVALGTAGGAVWEERLTGARRHASGVLPMVETLLRRAGVTLDHVTGLALSDGPGSFTGLRVGAAVAKALVRTRGLPLWVAPSLLVRAAGVAIEGDVVVAVANALRGEVYAAAYRFAGGAIVTELPPSVWRPEVLIQRSVRPTRIVGEIPAEVRPPLEAWAGSAIIAPPEGAPQAARLLDLIERPGGAVRVENAAGWEPIYGRPAEAQVVWETTHGRPFPHPFVSPT